MPTTITGTGGVNQVQDGVLTPEDINTSVNPAVQKIMTFTPISVTGTSVDFTGLPSWAKEITLMLDGVSTSGTSSVLIQLGTSEGIQNTGYTGASSVTSNAVNTAQFSAGFIINMSTEAATGVRRGFITFVNFNGNIWVGFGVFARSDTALTSTVAGSVTLSAVLDRVRLTTVNGTDTFDLGSIGLLVKG